MHYLINSTEIFEAEIIEKGKPAIITNCKYPDWIGKTSWDLVEVCLRSGIMVECKKPKK